MKVQETLDTLKALGTEAFRKTYRRHGAGEDVYGVSTVHLKALQKKIKTDQELAAGLWKSGNHDARILATKIADPERLDPKTLDAWVAGLRNYVEADALAEVAARAPNPRGTMDRWMASDSEWITSAGWKVMAHLARTEGALSDADCDRFLATVERDIHGAPNRVRHEMNSALIAIGGHHPALTEKALAAAARIGKVEVDHGDTDCKTPDAAGFIRKVLERKKR
jgi:3-methyladenine DNA glycosylase AlkD